MRWLWALILSLVADTASAQLGEKELFHVHSGFGLQWQLHSLRLGTSDFEIGRFNAITYGVAFRVHKGNLFGFVGPAYAYTGKYQFGVMSGLGYEKTLFDFIGLRAEANAAATRDGRLVGEVILGLSMGC